MKLSYKSIVIRHKYMGYTFLDISTGTYFMNNFENLFLSVFYFVFFLGEGVILNN